VKGLTPARAYAIAAAVFAVDRLTKWIIETRVGVMDAIPVIPGFFDIVHARNPGAAFSLFADWSSPVRTAALIAVSLSALGLIGWMLRKSAEHSLPTSIGLSLILGGALGNVFDRIRTGAVTDFLDFYAGSYHWPSFNAADSAIVIGSGLLILDMLRPKHEAART
jgi:signal peptidase II